MIAKIHDDAVHAVTLVRGARQLLTLRGPAGPRRGAALGDLGVIPDGALLIRGDDAVPRARRCTLCHFCLLYTR